MSTDFRNGTLGRFADRAASSPFFLGHVLARTDRSILARLFPPGTPSHAMTRLRLCRAPAAEEPQRSADIRAIAEGTGCDEAALREACGG